MALRHVLRRGRFDRTLRLSGVLLLFVASVVTLAEPALAHGAAIRSAAPEPLTIPTWLFLATGGGVVGVSFLLASFVTDRRYIRSLHAWGRSYPSPGRIVYLTARIGSVLLLGLTLAIGFFGPPTWYRNFAVLFVWVVWWVGYVATTYLVGDTWPAINPFRTVAESFRWVGSAVNQRLAEPLPSLDLRYPERLGAWPSVVGLLGLVWFEVTAPLAKQPRLLATFVAGYTVVTVAGAVAFGPDRWFETVDPIARVFRYYGRVAPFRRGENGIEFHLPGATLSETRYATGLDEVAFVIGLVFVTTYDGFVGTPMWGGQNGVGRALLGAGVPPFVLYLGTYLLGYVLFLGTYLFAAQLVRRFGETYLSTTYLACRFAPSLLAIAAGYHLAHNFSSVLSLSPAVVAVSLSPLNPPSYPTILVGFPGWFGSLDLVFVLVGHVLAVWVAHATAYELFPSRLQAIRSQYGVTAVMVLYTMTSLWIVSQPYVQPPQLP